MRNVFSWSGGKDSTATLILAHELGIQIDDVIFAEVMYDNIRGISGEEPEFISWVKSIAIPRIEEFIGGGGGKIHILHAQKDYIDLFFHRSTKGKNIGKMQGYVIPMRCLANSDLKRKPLHDFIKSIQEPFTHFVGIAIDEPLRLEKMKKRGQRSLLAEQGLTEADAKKLCEQHGLLAPTYARASRQGCWFCPNAKVKNWAYMAENYPALYNEFINLGGGSSLLINDAFGWGDTIKDLDKKVKSYIDNKRKQPELF